jgi:hypothetical protein
MLVAYRLAGLSALEGALWGLAQSTRASAGDRSGAENPAKCAVGQAAKAASASVSRYLRHWRAKQMPKP